jgi:hypothetical protein
MNTTESEENNLTENAETKAPAIVEALVDATVNAATKKKRGRPRKEEAQVSHDEPLVPADGITVENAEEKQETPPITAFREVTIMREFFIPLDEAEREELIARHIAIPMEVAAVERNKKAANDGFKHQINDLETEQLRIGVLITEGRETPVECRWMFKTAGKTTDGELINHPEMKTLVRVDNGDVVETSRMEMRDFDHEELNIGSAPPVPMSDDLSEMPIDDIGNEAPEEQGEEQPETQPENVTSGDFTGDGTQAE